ncbi:LysR family transcriptional regulator [Salinarimonas chemoclinalis]|uniref:LysR family transcriptional regulator n=1 Tax=Salinarimonas chemoclinalis TaxID=3241599 RepID=UPI003556D334
MDLSTLDHFARVARHGSFAAAAREREVDPSTISRAVADLEAELGLRLFQRTTRRLSLTEAGVLYLSRVEPLLDELARARDEALAATRSVRGTLRLTASTAFGERRIAPLLGAFRERHPELRVECVFTDANLDLVAERIDLAVRLAPAVEGDLVAARLMRTRHRVVASPAYIAANGGLASPGDLARRRCVLLDLPPYRSRWRVRHRSGTAEEEVDVAGDVVLSPAGAVRAAALRALGPALLPDWLIGEDLEAGRLVDLLPEHDVTATTFDTAAWIVYPSRAYLPLKVRAAIDFLREHVAADRRAAGRRRAQVGR